MHPTPFGGLAYRTSALDEIYKLESLAPAAINSFGFMHDRQSVGMAKIQSMPVMTAKLTSRRTNATPTANHGNQATTIRFRQRIKRANNPRHNNTLLRKSVATTL